MKLKLKLGLAVIAALSFGLMGCSETSSTVPNKPSTDDRPNTGISSGKDDDSNSSSSSKDPVVIPPDEDPDVYEPIQETLVTADGVTTGRLDKKGKYYTDYATKKESSIAGKELAVEIAEEGDVLLKNENNVLPLKSYERKVTLFGMHSVDLVVAGGGSGAGTLDNDGIEHSTLQSSLEDAGFKVNPRTISLYNTYQQIGNVNNELPLSNYTNSTIESYFTYSDAAIVTLSREGTENKDLATNNVADHADPDDHILQLDDNEVELIKHVKQHFKKVIVLINSSNIMQIPELAAPKTDDNLGVDAILWVGGVGNNGIDAVGSILNGSVNPSGHTSDIWPADFTKDPTWTNFGFDTQNKDAEGNRMDASYYDEDGNRTNYSQVEYRENIYLGYKYYETKAHDMGESGEDWYQENVLFPFGYGLSYTTFDWEWAGVEDNVVIDQANRTVTMRVKVTNTGDVAGKDVVQIYYSAPYTTGEIEKASNNLVNFAKTELLEPGESQIVEVQFVAQDMASFDYNDANKNGFSGYELEAGDYIITANRDSHTPILSTTRKIEEDIKCTTDYTSGKEIKPIFTGEYSSTNESLLNNQISRATGLKQPDPVSLEDRTLDDETLAEYDDQDIYYHSEDKTTDPWYVQNVPSNWTQGDIDPENPITLADMSGIDYEPTTLKDGVVTQNTTDEGTKKWDEFMNQLSWEDMTNIVSGDAKSGPGISAMANIGKPEDNYSDGPVQIRGGTLFPSNPILSATFNTSLAERKGRIIGNQAIFAGLSQWAGGGMNTHRSPFSGRNFEYFSQDSFHSARFSQAEVTGALSKGLITYCKHFFLNDQESYRADYGGVFTWATEQVIRENYLRPFEFAVKAGSMGLMSSFNRIGKQVTTNSYAIHQYLLRDEWDSKADVCTDAWAKAYVTVNKMAVSGSDQLLGQSSSYEANSLDHGVWSEEKNTVLVAEGENVSNAANATVESDTFYYGIRTRAQRALYTRANSSTAQNGFTAGENIVVTLERDVDNNVPITVAGTNDISVSLSEDSAQLPDGLRLVNGNVISGKPTAETPVSSTVDVDITADGWITSTAKLTINVVSAIQLDGVGVTNDGKNLALNQAYSGKISAPSLAYGTQLSSGLIVNWFEYDFANYNRDEDKTASDIVTIPYEQAEVKHEYGYSITGNVPGLKFETVNRTWQGLSNRGSYEVPDYMAISGTPTQAGDFTITVTLNIPTTMYMSGWLFTFGCREIQYVQTITFHVA